MLLLFQQQLIDSPDLSVYVWRVLMTVAVVAGLAHYRISLPRKLVQATQSQQQRIVAALATAINAKDNITFEHVRRVQIYAEGMGRLMNCTSLELRALQKAALLHDIGKIAVSDAVLKKQGKLTRDEFTEMKQHTVVGAAILEKVGFEVPVVPIVRHHHERWDGTGYPDALKGEEIPLCARILSIVDCFDAVREDRQYRKGLTRQEAIDLVLRESGGMYDPHLVGLFLTHLPEFEAQINAERIYQARDFGVTPPSPLSAIAQQTPPAAGLAN